MINKVPPKLCEPNKGSMTNNYDYLHAEHKEGGDNKKLYTMKTFFFFVVKTYVGIRGENTLDQITFVDFLKQGMGVIILYCEEGAGANEATLLMFFVETVTDFLTKSISYFAGFYLQGTM